MPEEKRQGMIELAEVVKELRAIATIQAVQTERMNHYTTAVEKEYKERVELTKRVNRMALIIASLNSKIATWGTAAGILGGLVISILKTKGIL